MAPMSLSPRVAGQLSDSERQTLLDVARRSIRHGLEQGGPLKVLPSDFPAALQAHRACFVTLDLDGQLRGCIGSLQASEPLVANAARNAHAAAFSDPRFPPVRADEEPRLELHISILSPPQPMTVTSQDDLLRQLRPGLDGLILTDGWHRGTFLPAVWKDLPDPSQFLAHLKLKAGLPVDYWSPSLRFHRYTCESVP